MTTITTRSGKGSPLTNNEVDANFTNLNSDKYESGDNVSLGTITADNTVLVESTSQSKLSLNTQITSGTGSLIEMRHDRAGDTVTGFGDDLGTIDHVFRDSAGNLDVGVRVVGAMGGSSGDNTSGQERTSYKISTLKGSSTLSDVFEITRSGDIGFYDEAGSNLDLFWDASVSSLGIGTTIPVQTLHVKSANPVIRLEDSNPDGIYGQIDGAGGSLILTADGGNGNASSVMSFRVDGTAASAELMRLTSSEVTVNEQSNDVDFRVESNTNTHMLFVDAGEDRVGIGTSAPSERLTIKANGNADILGIEMSGNLVNLVSLNQYNDHGAIFVRQNNGVVQHSITATGGVVFNEGSLDQDFRIESNGGESAFFVDGGTNNIGIGTSTTYAHQQGTAIDMVYSSTIWAGGTYWAGGLKLGESFYVTTSGEKYKLSSRQATMGYYNSQGGSIHFYSAPGGTADDVITWQELAEFDRSEVVFNNGSADQDFRVESDNNSHMLFVDAGNDRVQFGKSSGGNTQDAGVEIQSTGFVGIAADGIRPVQINRLTDSGDVIELRQANTEFAVLGVESGELVIGTGNVGLRFADSGTDRIIPRKTSYANATNAIDLGDTGSRFKRLYLADGINDLGQAGSETVFNDGSTTADFRVESNTSTHALFVDAGNNAVGIGSSDPSANQFKVGIAANFVTTTGTTPFNITRTGGTDQALQIYVDDTNVYFDSVQDEVGLASGGYYFRSSNGTNDNQNLLIMNQTGTTFNENSLDADFRVESNNNAYTLFVNAGTDSVGIKIASPNENLHIHEESSEAAGIAFTNNTTGTTASDGGFIGLGSGEQMYLWNREANSVILGSNDDTRLEIDQYGNIAARFNDTTDFFSLGGTNLVNGVTAKPSNAGTPLALARDTGTLRSAHFAGHLKFDDGYGVDFGISSGGGASSTVLDDYEEGDYDVTITPETSGTVTLDTGFNRAQYTKVGRTVHVSGFIVVSSVSSPQGFFKMNLPFTPANLTDRAADSTATLVIQGVVSANISDFIGTINEAQAFIFVQLGDSNTVQNDSAEQLTTNTYISFSATYTAA